MASRLIPLLALTFAVCAQGYNMPMSPASHKRDIYDFAGYLLYTSVQQGGMFLEIDVGDNMVPVQLDTRSSDLFVSGTLQDPGQFMDTGTTALLGFSYLQLNTATNAPIITGNVTIAGKSASQAFLHDSNQDLGFQNIFPWSPAQGVIGLGPTSSSTVQTVQGVLSPLDTLYVQDPAHPFSTLLYAGIDESDSTFTDTVLAGFFSVGATVNLGAIFANIGGLNTSALPPLDTITSQPVILLDPNRYSFNLDLLEITSDPGGSVTNQTTIIDTRSNVTFAPPNIISIILGSAPGVSQDPNTGTYTLPCNTEVAMDMVIGGVTISIDPATIVVKVPGTDICVSAFQELANGQAPPGVTVIFGTNILQNLYLLLGYHSVHAQTLSDPYYQFLGLTDPQDAHNNFVATRSGQQSSSSSAWSSSAAWPWSSGSPAGNPAQSGPAGAAPTGAAERLAGSLDVQNNASGNDLNLPSGSLSDKLKHCLPAIILGLIGLIVLLVGFAIYAIVSRRGRSGAKESAYRNIHHAEAADNSRALYGHEEDSMGRYSDPYSDKL